MAEMRDADRIDLAVRRARRVGLGMVRMARWVIEGWQRPEIGEAGGSVLWRRVMPIRGLGVLEEGKRRNLALAAPAFDGVEVSVGRPLSFWRTLGPATAARGFGAGIEIAGGCVMPAIGGGLCLLSNALFAMAAELGWHVIERHGHSIALADPRALDATVAWPHVDLRIAPRNGNAVLEVGIERDALVVAARGERDGLDVAIEREHAREGEWVDVRVRRRVARGAQVIEDRLLVEDRKRVLAELRTCLDCEETACRARRTV